MNPVHEALRKKAHHDNDGWYHEAKFISDVLEEKRKHRCGIMQGIEIGCGNRKVMDDAIGIDVKSYPGVTYIASGDDLHMLKDESQDYVVACHVLEHFLDPVKALAEWKRILKWGGILAFSCPDCRAPLNTFALNPEHKFVTTPFILEELVYLTGEFKKRGEGVSQPLWTFSQIWQKKVIDEPGLHFIRRAFEDKETRYTTVFLKEGDTWNEPQD
jgi:SAM-dependent methyltransferase